jgi:hypothetical protein
VKLLNTQLFPDFPILANEILSAMVPARHLEFARLDSHKRT